MAGRDHLERAELPAASRQVIDVGLRMIDALDKEIDALDAQVADYARRQRGCQALQRHWGIGPLMAPTILAELGDTRRFSSSRQAVRFAGMDVTVSESDGHRRRGRLSRQGSPVLRWALHEAAGHAYRKASPDHDYYLETKARLGAKRARLSVARRMLRRLSHDLANLGDEAFADVA
jgi:transposase